MAGVQVLSVGPTPTLFVNEIEGDLQVTGWDRSELHLRGPKADEITRNSAGGEPQAANEIRFSARRNCQVQTPLQSSLRAERVEGNASINLLLGSVELEVVDGNFAANSTGPLTLGQVDGNLSVRAVAGGFSAQGIDGNARIAQVAGDLYLGSVDGNLSISEVVGSVTATADGDVDVSLNLVAGQHVLITADGNITCRIQPDAGAVVTLEAEGNIRVKNLGEQRRDEDTCLEFVLGDGGAIVDLHAEGSITLIGSDVRSLGGGVNFDPNVNQEMNEEMARRAAELGQQIAHQVESQVGVLTRELEEKLANMNNDEMANKIQDRVSSALRRAEEKLAEAMRKMEVREGDRRRKGYGWQSPPVSPTPPTPPVGPVPPPPPKRPQANDEDRMMILRMVESGKISVEQAERLLAALNGNV
jgi:hypothetical protein